MFALTMIGTTSAGGTLTIERRLLAPMRLVRVRWMAGDLVDGVDAVLEETRLDEAANALGVASASLDTVLLALIDANDDAWYDLNAVVNQAIRLTITNGGATKRGGCIAYFEEASGQSEVTGAVAVSGPVTVGGVTQPTIPRNGKTTVATAGTRVQLGGGASIPLLAELTVKAGIGNSGTIYVGDGAVSASNGFELSAGQEKQYIIDNVNRIWIDASTAAQYVTWAGS